MPTTMRAAVVRAFGQALTIEEMLVPTPGPGEVLVKIEATGVCHTDLHAADGDWPIKPALPFVPGHEGAGIVAALDRASRISAKVMPSESLGSTMHAGCVSSA
jgi:alcohol dehydrogenase, propanol-preferring